MESFWQLKLYNGNRYHFKVLGSIPLKFDIDKILGGTDFHIGHVIELDRIAKWLGK